MALRDFYSSVSFAPGGVALFAYDARPDVLRQLLVKSVEAAPFLAGGLVQLVVVSALVAVSGAFVTSFKKK